MIATTVPNRPTARVIDGRAVAASLRSRIAGDVARFVAEAGRAPGLATVLVGEDPASQVYVRNKGKAAAETGIASFRHQLPAGAPEAELLALVRRLNIDPLVDGILVQLPLPPQMREAAAIDAIDPAKDVDGFHLVNAGALATGAPGLVPCTPAGCMLLLEAAGVVVEGAHAVVIGRSNIVGKPLAQLLLQANATVTVAHSRTRGLPALARTADILVAAVGRPEMVRGDWVKPGAAIIDVGINRVPGAEPGTTRLVGDVAYEEAAVVAGAITPVPGGVGPMTIACLLANTLAAARSRAGLETAPSPARDG